MKKKKAIIAEKYFDASLQRNKNDYNSLLEKGKALMIQEKYEEAIKCFNECGIIDSFSVYHIIEKGNCYIKKGEINNAFKMFDLSIKKKPKNYFAYLRKGELLYNLGKYEEAKEVLNICNELAYNRNSQKVILGKIEYLTGNPDIALKMFDNIIENDLENNILYNISDIGYFFHQRGEKELAYKYYLKSERYNKWQSLSDETVEKHIKDHSNVTLDDKMHSVFNFNISIDLLKYLIKDIEKSTTKHLYDVYQIHCENAGYMYIDENSQIQEDYITILTLPFTKKIMNSYPDGKLPNSKIYKSVNLDDLKNYDNIIVQENDNNIVEEETLYTTNDMDMQQSVECKTNDKNTNVADEQIIERKSIDESINVTNESIKEKEIVDETDTILITNNLGSYTNLDFEKHREQIKMLINLLNDSTQKVVLLLRLGYVNNKYYTEEEIAKFLEININDVNVIINSGLSNIIGISTFTIQGVESARNQIEFTKNYQTK